MTCNYRVSLVLAATLAATACDGAAPEPRGDAGTIAATDGGPPDDPVVEGGGEPGPAHPLAAWTGRWEQPAGTWQWECVGAFDARRGGTQTEEGDVRYWEIRALDERRIHVASSGGVHGEWNYVVEGDVATIEEGSFSGGALVDEPGAEVLEIRETLTRQADGSLLNEVYYRFTYDGEACTETQEIRLTRGGATRTPADPEDVPDDPEEEDPFACTFDGTCDPACDEDPDCCAFNGVCEAGCADDPDCCAFNGECEAGCDDDPDC